MKHTFTFISSMFQFVNMPNNILCTTNKDEVNPGNVKVYRSAEQKHTELRYHWEEYKQK